jgi:hypothetical protein
VAILPNLLKQSQASGIRDLVKHSKDAEMARTTSDSAALEQRYRSATTALLQRNDSDTHDRLASIYRIVDSAPHRQYEVLALDLFGLREVSDATPNSALASSTWFRR